MRTFLMTADHRSAVPISTGRKQNVVLSCAAQARLDVAAYFEELRQPVYRYLLCAGLSADDADESVQETFLRLHEHLRKNGDRTNLRGWVFQVARNLAWNKYRSERRRRTDALEDKPDQTARIRDPKLNPEDQALDRERALRLRRSMGKLPAQQRDCLLLRAAGLRYREIAETLGIGISGVGQLVHRATARLNEELS